MTIIRKVIVCEGCGASVGYYDDICHHCQSNLEPLATIRHKLPCATSNPNAKPDSELIGPMVEFYGNFGRYIRPIHIDEHIKAMTILRDHEYLFRDYIIDLLSLLYHFRSRCFEHDEDRRQIHLEIFKCLEAIHKSLTK